MTVPIWSDEKLLELIKAGDHAAFEKIYAAYWSKLYLSAYNVLRDRQSSEDIVQEVLYRLWVRRETVKIDCLRSYLHTAVRYQVFSAIKRGKGNPRPLEDVPEPASGNDIFDMLYEKDLQLALNERIGSLPAKCREIFILSRNRYLSTAEIAALLGIAPKTVENQLTIAIRRLRISMKGLFLCVLIMSWFFYGPGTAKPDAVAYISKKNETLLGVSLC